MRKIFFSLQSTKQNAVSLSILNLRAATHSVLRISSSYATVTVRFPRADGGLTINKKNTNSEVLRMHTTGTRGMSCSKSGINVIPLAQDTYSLGHATKKNNAKDHGAVQAQEPSKPTKVKLSKNPRARPGEHNAQFATPRSEASAQNSATVYTPSTSASATSASQRSSISPVSDANSTSASTISPRTPFLQQDFNWRFSGSWPDSSAASPIESVWYISKVDDESLSREGQIPEITPVGIFASKR